MCVQGWEREQTQSRHLIKNISGTEQQSCKPSFEKKALKPLNEENIGQPALPIHDIILHFEHIICKASYSQNEMFHNYILLGVLFCCLDVHKQKSYTSYLEIEKYRNQMGT